MFDIDPVPSTLRLGINLQTVKTRHEERADIRRQIESLLVRHCELTMLIDAEHAQSQPIRISASNLIGPEGISGGRGHEGIPGKLAGVSHRDGSDLVTDMHDGRQERIANFFTDNDFWTHRHRVMGGSDVSVTHSTGHVERLRAAANSEIRDPAESLRFSRMVHEPLYEDDGA